MTTTPAMPELPEPDRTMWQHGTQIDHYTADQMRAYALATLQAQPAAAGVSDAEIFAIADEHADGGHGPVGEPADWYGFEQKSLLECIRAILALRQQPAGLDVEAMIRSVLPGGYSCDPQQVADAIRDYMALRPQAVPMTDEQIVAAFKACDLEDPSKEGWIWRTRIKWARAIESHHGITAPAGGEKQA